MSFLIGAAKRFALCLVGAAFLLSPWLAAEDHVIDFDHHADFAQFKTFAIHQGLVNSPRPELNNRLFVQMMTDAVGDRLSARGLTQATTSPDLLVEFTVTVSDISTTTGRRDIVIPPGPREGRATIIPEGPAPVRYVHGTLLLDLTARATGALVWRGTSQENQTYGTELVRRLAENVGKLVAEYPSVKR